MRTVLRNIAAVVAVGLGATASAATDATWVSGRMRAPVREDRLADLNELLARAKEDPALACDRLVPEAERSGRFENGSSLWGGGKYQERDVLKYVKQEACGCRDRMASAGKMRPDSLPAPETLSPSSIGSADAATLVGVADSFRYPAALSEAALQRLPDAIKSAPRDVLARIYTRGDQAIMGSDRNPSLLVGNTWVKCFNETRFTPFSDNFGRGLGLHKLLEARREEVAVEAGQRQAEDAKNAQQQRDAERLAAARQTVKYWADELGAKLWSMTSAVNRAAEMEKTGYGTLARDKGWPAARQAEQDLCATIADLRSTAPHMVREARDNLVKDIAYRQGDGPAANAGALLDRHLKGECNLFGR